jgi:hypothetical protein
VNTVDHALATLSDQQVLSILGSIAGEFADNDWPQGQNEESAALQSAFERLQIGGDVQRISTASAGDAANAARALLVAMAGSSPDVRTSVEAWINEPPTQEAAAIPLILAAPIVITGCIAFLHIVGHTRFVRSEDGRWRLDYDPTKESPMDKVTPALGKVLDVLSK